MTRVKNTCGDRENYRIRWGLDGVKCGVEFFDDSDWFSSSLELGINTSLYEQGYKERLIWLDSGDQTAIFIFADPAIIEASGLNQL